MTPTAPEYARQPAELLRRLLRFDTTNPPGNERDCLLFVRDLLAEAGIESRLPGQVEARPNLLARLPGRGASPPLLLYGHVDVVTAANQNWTRPPFAGVEDGGFIWGRGALDMKGGVAMMLAAFLRAKIEALELPGDVILALVCDEEAGGDLGARFLVENEAAEFTGVRYALGEFGGFPLALGGRRFYPIQIAEKQVCWMRALLRGPGGHGSMPVRGGAMTKLAGFLRLLDRRRLPVHITPVARLMVETMAAKIGGARGLFLRGLLNPLCTDGLLDLLGENGRFFDPLLHNTVSPTELRGSGKINVIPNEIAVGLDGRLLPGYHPDDLLRELRGIGVDGVEFEISRYDPGPADPEMGLYATLAEILCEADPEGVPVPFLMSGVTDARFFSRLGIQTYGFLPLQLPADFNFIRVIHAADERIPAAALEFGTAAIYRVLRRF